MGKGSLAHSGTPASKQGSLPLLPLSSWQKSQPKSQWRAASWRERSRFPCSWQNAVVDSQWEELSLYMKPGVMRLSVQCWSVLMRTVWLILYCTHYPVFPWYPPHQKKKKVKKWKKKKASLFRLSMCSLEHDQIPSVQLPASSPEASMEENHAVTGKGPCQLSHTHTIASTGCGAAESWGQLSGDLGHKYDFRQQPRPQIFACASMVT